MANNPVHDFILASQDNLRIAAAVESAWPEARQKLVDGFVGRLNSALMKKFKGWKWFEPETSCGFFVDQWPGEYWYKPEWEEQYSLCLAAHEFGAKMVFGILREQDFERIKKRP